MLFGGIFIFSLFEIGKIKIIPIRNINWSYCQFERSREPLDHLDCARCDKKGLDFYICLIGIINRN